MSRLTHDIPHMPNPPPDCHASDRLSDSSHNTETHTRTVHASLITCLCEIQRQLCSLTKRCGEAAYRKQFHPALSAVGWHLGHTTFIENLWIRETLLGDNSTTAAVRALYLPQNAQKSMRGRRLPAFNELTKECARMQSENLSLLDSPPMTIADHRLMRDNYLLKFLTQHHAMHLETMHMILTERNLREKATGGYSPQQRLKPVAMHLNPVAFRGGAFEMGGIGNECMDNELPRHQRILGDFSLNATAVTNAEFLGFLESGGYRNAAWWDDAGWRWLKQTRVHAPHHWRQNQDSGDWYGVDSSGCHNLEANTPVQGLSRHEAQAFAHYAGARLPHEGEWEAAHTQKPAHPCIHLNEDAWEWCDNMFYPYPGFKPFPYKEYSKPWFNDTHYTLRGRSRYTPQVLHRRTFRNFYTADKRHIFAGVRVAMV